METIITNPGLQHLAEIVFWNLAVGDLKIFAQINQTCKQILQNPIFCLSKFEHLSKKNREDWIKAIQSVKNPAKGIAIISYLLWNLKEKIVDFPCYSNPTIQDDFREKIWKCCTKPFDGGTEIVKIVAPLTDNPNKAPFPNKIGMTPMYWAAWNGCTEIVKILAPLTDNPNAPTPYGSTPIHVAACFGHTEIVKILALMTDNPNAPNNTGETPIHVAARFGHAEIVKILAPFTDNPNAPNKTGKTPIHLAVLYCRLWLV